MKEVLPKIQGTVTFEQNSATENLTITFSKFEGGIEGKFGLHVHTFSNFHSAGKHFGGVEIPYEKV